MSMNWEEKSEMRQLEIRIERLEKELNELNALMTKKRKSESTEKAVADSIEDAEVR